MNLINLSNFGIETFKEELKISNRYKNVDIDVLIVTHNRPDDLKECLDSLKIYSSNVNIYLFDNASDNDSVDIYRSYHLTKFFRSEKNLGFIYPNNLLYKHSKSPYVILLNDDVIVYRDWYKPIISFLQNYSEIGVTGYLGGCLDENGVGINFNFGYNIDYICGWCLAFRRKDVYYLFDENLKFAYAEDSEFCLRMKESGKKCYALHLDLVRHKGSQTALNLKDEDSIKNLNENFHKNHLYLQKKHKDYLLNRRVNLGK